MDSPVNPQAPKPKPAPVVQQAPPAAPALPQGYAAVSPQAMRAAKTLARQLWEDGNFRGPGIVGLRRYNTVGIAIDRANMSFRVDLSYVQRRVEVQVETQEME